jgi:hypothetical protein
MEALVPGYVTEQGEVLVPFDTVVGDKNKVVAVLEDPNYNNKAPVVLGPEENENEAIPKFFNPSNKQIYYSDVPPPGSIFTFDEDNEVEVSRSFRKDSSEENEEDEEDEEESVEERVQRPSLAYVQATAASGEDDEADSLGVRLRMEQARRER